MSNAQVRQPENTSSGLGDKDTGCNKDIIFRGGRSCSVEHNTHRKEVETLSVDYA